MVVTQRVHSHCQVIGLSAQCGSTQWEVKHNPWLLVIVSMVIKLTVCATTASRIHSLSRGMAQSPEGLHPALIN